MLGPEVQIGLARRFHPFDDNDIALVIQLRDQCRFGVVDRDGRAVGDCAVKDRLHDHASTGGFRGDESFAILGHGLIGEGVIED